MTRTLAALAAILLAGTALALPKAEADKAVEGFIMADGFEPMATDPLDGQDSPYAKRFTWSAEDALRPDAQVGPVEKALLAVETLEQTQPDRVRYAVSYAQVTEDGADTMSLVEVRRYNMGPLIHKATQDDYGPENTAPVEEFGVGPDVAWRFAFAPVMGNLAAPLSMSRKVIGEGADQMKDDPAHVCPAGPCRLLHEGSADAFKVTVPAGAREEMVPHVPVGDVGTPRYSVLLGTGDITFPSAAFVARELSTALKLTEPEGMPGVWHMPETPEGGGPAEPFIVFQVDQNLGQDTGDVGLGGIIRTGDDEILQHWTTLYQHGPEPIESASHRYVKRQ